MSAHPQHAIAYNTTGPQKASKVAQEARAYQAVGLLRRLGAVVGGALAMLQKHSPHLAGTWASDTGQRGTVHHARK